MGIIPITVVSFFRVFFIIIIDIHYLLSNFIITYGLIALSNLFCRHFSRQAKHKVYITLVK